MKTLARFFAGLTLLALFGLAALPALAQSQIGGFGGGGSSSGQFQNVTWATLPSPSNIAGRVVFVTNAGTKGSVWVSDGTRWKPLNGCATLATLDTTSSNIANSETIVFQYQLPANLLQLHDRLRFYVSVAKSGTTDTGILRVRMGTAGTTADTQIITANSILGAANRTAGAIFDFRLETATTVQQLPNSGANNIAMTYGSVANIATASPVTITSAAANSLFASVSILSGSTNDTIVLNDAQLLLCATGN